MTNDRKIAAPSALLLGLGLASANGAADEQNLMFCAASQAIVCPEQGECTRGLPETANLPRLLRISVADREVVSLNPGGERRTSKGAVVGAVAGDAGAGAAAGAVGGALFGGMQRRTPDTAGGDIVSGAARGAVVGGIAGDAGAGAAAGAVGGVLFGGMRRSR